MSEDYLWDRSGKVDPEVKRLETLLAGYRHRAGKGGGRSRNLKLLAAAACLVLFASAMYWLQRNSFSEWEVAGKRLFIGQTVETDSESSAKLEAGAFGQVDLSPNSRLQVMSAKNGNQLLALRRGTLRAFIWAPPAKFQVDTPSAKTIDLGCVYTLSVLPDDSGLVTVETGWVAFQNGATESFIPAGAACRTRPGVGPGLPYFLSASQQLRDAIAKFDVSSGKEGLPEILASSRKKDALTLWHLVVRTEGAERKMVAERFASLLPEIDVPGLNAGDSKSIDAAWNLLGQGETEWWRLWKHRWQK